jgi:hypothetical protein
VSEEEVHKLTDKVAKGTVSEKVAEVALIELAKDHEANLYAKAAGQLFREGVAESSSAVEMVEPVEGEAVPSGLKPVFGGRCKLQGLQKAAELNGATGRIESWNKDGRRRFGVLLDSGKMLSLQPRNLVPVDAAPFPEDFTCDSRTFCAALEAEMQLHKKTLKNAVF